MKVFNRCCALFLALVLALSPLGMVGAVSTDSESSTPQGVGAVTPPLLGSDPVNIGNLGVMTFACSDECSSTGWYRNFGGATITVELAEALSTVVVSYYLNGGSRPVIVDLETPDRFTRVANIPSLPDGVHTISVEVSARASDTAEVKQISIMVDSVAPDISQLTVGSLNIKDNVGYSGEFYTVSGASDATSGLAKVETFSAGVLSNAYVGSVGTKIYKDTDTVVFHDKAGNSCSASVKDIYERFCSEVVFDTDYPSISVSVVEEPKYADSKYSYYKGKATLSISVADDNLSVVNVYANGGQVFSQEVSGGSATVTFALEESDKYEIEAFVKDISGNLTGDTIFVCVDNVAPKKGSLALRGVWVLHNGSVVTNSPVTLGGSASDPLSGVKLVEVLKDGAVVSSSIPCTITESGSYSLKITDNVGNVTNLSLSSITGGSNSDIIVDSSSPKIEIKLPTPAADNFKGVWFTEQPKASLSVSDDLLKSVDISVIVDGEEFSVASLTEPVSDYVVDFSQWRGLDNTLIVRATDIAGNVNSKSTKFMVDSDPPVISEVTVSPEPALIKDGKMFFTSAVTVTVHASDSGYEGLTYYLGGEENKSGVFTGLGDGVYSLSVKDGLGNKTDEVSLGHFFGVDNASVVIVLDPPTIEAVGLNGVWVASPPVYLLSATDEAGINEYSVFVDGKEVDKNTFSFANQHSLNVTVDLSSLPDPCESGKHTIEFVVKNNAGLESRWTDVVNVDLLQPSVGSLKVEGSVNEVDGSVYSGSSLVVTGMAEDPHSGIKYVHILEGTEVVGTSIPYSVLSSGTYFVEICDNVGNTTKVPLSSIMGTSSNVLVIDEELPSISFDKESIKPSAMIGGRDWFNFFPQVSLSVGDNIGSNTTVVIEVDGESYEIFKDYIDLTGSVLVDSSKFKGQDYRILVTAEDNSGNSSSAEYSFSVDVDSPLVGSLQVVSDYVDTDVEAVSNTGFEFTGSVEDTGSGIIKLSVYRDGVLCFESIDGSVDVIFDKEADSGVYTVVAEDGVGNKSTFNANMLLGSKSSMLSVDKTKPSVEFVSVPAEDASGWYTVAPTFGVAVNDARLLKYTVTINGEVVLEGSKSESFEIVTEDFTNTGVSVIVYAQDIVGNFYEVSRSYRHDNAPPFGLKASFSSAVNEKAGYVFLQETASVSLSAEDKGYKNLSFFVNDVLLSDNSFEVSGSGAYLIYVSDGLGNKSDPVELSVLCGWSSNNIIVDTEDPIIVGEKFSNKWVSYIPVYSINAKDNIGIHNVSVSVNGEQVVNKLYDSHNYSSECYEVDLSSVPMADNGRYSILVEVVDNSGRKTSWSDSVYVDITPPEVSDISIKGYTSAIGDSIGGGDKYGFFFNGDGKVTITASDTKATAGLSSLYTRLEGYDWVEHDISKSSLVVVDVPSGFKGRFEAYAVDKVGNKGAVSSPDLFVDESEELHTANSFVSIVPQNTEHSDASGLPLYNSDVLMNVSAGCSVSGIQKVDWILSADGMDPVSGTEEFEVMKSDLNLATLVASKFSVFGNYNNMSLCVTATDGVGHKTSSTTAFSIDTDKPIILVEYQDSVEDVYLNGGRSAIVSVVERNFDPALFVVEGTCGTLSSWVNKGSHWEAVISFEADGEYSYVLSCVDRAGNASVPYESTKFVVDTTKPIISRVDSSEETMDGWFNYTPELKFHVSDTNFQKYTVFVNSKEVLSGYDCDIVVDTAEYTNIPVNVLVYAEDKSGNNSTYAFSYCHDNLPPKDITVEVDTPVYQKEDSVYFNSEFNVQVSATDGEGYGNLVYKLNSVSNSTGSFTVSSGGEYCVCVYDGLGHVSDVIPLNVLAGWGGNNVVINNSLPTVQFEKLNSKWVNAHPVYEITSSSTIGLDSVVIYINGVEVVSKGYASTDVLSDTIVVNLNDYPMADDFSYSISVVVTDNSQLSVSDSDRVFVDLNGAEVGSMIVNGSWEVHDGSLFTNKPITVEGYPVDAESGVASVEILRDEVAVGTLPYSIVESGTYSIRVTDSVGNVVVFPLGDIAGEKYSTVVMDSVIPTVYIDLARSDSPQYVNGLSYWYSSNPVIYVGMTDDNMSEVSVTVIIDGGTTVVVSDILKDGIYAIDTSYASGKEFKVVAFARDKSGNTSEDSYSFYVDREAPVVNTMSATATPFGAESNGVVYVSGSFTISGSPLDVDSGVKSVEIVCGEGEDSVVYNYLADGGFTANSEEQSGEYWVILTDNVGNERKVGLKEFLGVDSNVVVIDHTTPTIYRTDSNEETVHGWYNYAPTLSFRVEDSYISTYSVYVNEDLVANGSKSESITIATDKYLNKQVSVVVEVADLAGNSASYKYNYSHDNTCPADVVVVAPKPSNQKGGNVYFNDSVVLTVSANDVFYGGEEFFINGVKISGEYVVSASGEYSLEVRDGLGNSTGPVPIQQYLQWNGNSIVIDKESPKIEASSYDGKWIKGVGSYSFSVTDNSGIDSVSIVANGKEVSALSEPSTNNTSVVMSADTGMVDLNKDGSFSITVTVLDNSGLVSSWSDVVYVDNVKPTIADFLVSGSVNSLNTFDGYGYFFNGEGYITVVSSDDAPSGGLSSIWTRFNDGEWVSTPVNSSGEITIQVPENFKGVFEAYVVDSVGNISAIKSPVKMISEGSVHESNSSMGIVLRDTPYTDVNGLPLYSADSAADITVSCNWSGVQYLVWGVDGASNKVTDLSSGTYDYNIVTDYSMTAPLSGNLNGMKLQVSAVDWANHVSTKEVLFSIDKDAPIVTVSYDTTVENGCYRVTRVANIRVVERNFDPNKFVVGGTGGTLGAWSNEGDVWSNTLSFVEDGNYQFTLDCTDRAGNSAVQYSSDSFIIDKVMPKLSVSWDNSSPLNGFYYNSDRTATVSVVERNFNSSLFALSGNGSLSHWSSSGDVHTAYIKFESDGVYSFSITGEDLAGNTVESVYTSGSFVIDKTSPEVTFSKISEGVSYKSDVAFDVTTSDTNLSEESSVSLSSNLLGVLDIEGIFNGDLGSFSYSDFPDVKDTDGVYTISVHAVDKAGNVSDTTLSFSVNRYGSEYSCYNAEVLGNYIQDPQDIVLVETNVDRLDMDAIEFTVTRDGTENKLDRSLVSISEEFVGGRYVYTYTVSKEAFKEDGKYSLFVLSKAEEGSSYSSASEQYDFIVDKTAPTVIISGVDDGGTYHEYERSVAVDSRDLYGLKFIHFYVNDILLVNFQETDGVYTFTVSESEDPQTIRVEATDMAGNTAVVRVENFLITSNTLVYLTNQTWFWAIVLLVVVLIILMLVLLVRNRVKDRNKEKEAIRASGELYQSSAGSSSGGDSTGSENQILSGDSPEIQQGAVPQESSVVESASTDTTGAYTEGTTGFVDDDDSNTGVM